MGILTYLVYPVRSIAKNRMRSLYAVIGIILAISFFSGSFIAVDSSANALVRAAMDWVQYDSAGTGYMNDLDLPIINRTVSALGTVADVINVTPMLSLYGWSINKPNSTSTGYDYYSPYGPSGAVFLPKDSTILLRSHKINGSMPSPGTVAISRATADRIGVDVNDEINLTFANYQSDYINGTYVDNYTYANLTLKVSQIWTQYEGAYLPRYYYSGTPTGDVNFGYFFSNPVVLNLADAGLLISAQKAITPYVSINLQYLVYVDRDKVVSTGDIAGTVERLQFINNRLTIKGSPYGVSYFDNNLGNVLGGLSASMEGNKILFFALSLPVMMLGSYLSVVGYDLATSERRREIGILKARGATKRQVLGEMAVESILLGAIAGIVGLLGGILMSRFMLGISTSFLGASAGIASPADLAITGGTLIATIFFGILLMAISAYRPIKRLIRTEISEALHFFSPSEARKEYHPKWDIVALALSGLSIFAVVATAQKWFQNGYGSFIEQTVVLVLTMVGIALLPVMPLMLSVGTIRLLTRGPKRIYRRLASIVKPWTKNVHYLVEMNIERNPKRSSMMCMIIALAVAFGLFVSVTMESTLAYQKDLVKYQIGADINANGQSGIGYGYYAPDQGAVNIHMLDKLNSTPGIDTICRYYSLSPTYGYGYLPSGFTIFNASAYSKAVQPADFWFVGAGADKLKVLGTSGMALISEDMAKSLGILVGDVFSMKASFKRENQSDLDVTFNVEIAGMVKGLPGLYSEGIFIDRSTLANVSDDTFVNSSQGSVTVGFLADLKEGGNHTAIAEQVQAAFEDAGLQYVSVSDMKLALENIDRDPYYGALTQFFNTEYAISMAIMTVGVAMIIFVTVSERRQEIACIMARGSSGAQMEKILMGESITLMTLGLIVGTAVGLLTAFLYNYLTGSLSSQPGHSIVLTLVSVSILLVAIASMLVASFLTTVRAGRIKLAEILRIRGG